MTDEFVQWKKEHSPIVSKLAGKMILYKMKMKMKIY